MLFRLVRPVKRIGSTNLDFVQRIPTDVRPRAVGRVLAVPLGGSTVRLTILPRTDSIRLSLRTRDPSEGHLFLRPGKAGNVLGPMQGLKNRLAAFARAIITDPNVAPNHGWKHRFKTVGMEAGIPPRVLDTIQG